MKAIHVKAEKDNLDRVIDFVNGELENYDCSMKAQMQIDIAIEEIFVNIANYAYNPEVGEATVQCEVYEDPMTVEIQFLDQGKPYNPLLKEDPDVSLSVEERPVGGLGIFMVKKSMDCIEYQYSEGKNILTIKKKI